MLPLKNKKVLITGGTGSLGKVLTKRLLSGVKLFTIISKGYLNLELVMFVIFIL